MTTMMMRDTFAVTDEGERALTFANFTGAVRDLTADWTAEEIVADWTVEEWADGIGADGDPVVQVRKWTPEIENDSTFGEILVWRTEGWR
jgi:hypothetical protein